MVADVNETWVSETESPNEKLPIEIELGPVFVNVTSNALLLEGVFALALPALIIRLALSGGDDRPNTSAASSAQVRKLANVVLLNCGSP